MKKRVILGTILPAAAAIAVIGSGYAIWHFNDTASKLTSDMSLSITSVVKGASLEKNFDTLSLEFDQTETSRKDVNSKENTSLGSTITENGTETANGISFVAKSGETAVTEATVTYKEVTNTDDSGVSYATPTTDNGNVGQVFTVTLSLPTSVAEYISITTTSLGTGWTIESNGVADTTTNTTTWKFKNTAWSTSDNPVTWSWSNISFSYGSDKEPTDYAGYKKLSDALKATDNPTATATYEAYRSVK